MAIGSKQAVLLPLGIGKAENALDGQFFRLLVQSVKDYAIIMLDPAGHVISWNQGAERIKGYRAEEILGRSFTAFYPEDKKASGFPQRELEAALRDGRFEDEGWRVRKDGSRIWANVVITALRNDDGQLVGFAKVTRDLSERRKAEEQRQQLAAEQAARKEATRRSDELQRLNAELTAREGELATALSEAREARDAAERSRSAVEEAYKELDQFAYVASHDLKAPLRGIANLAEWIREESTNVLTPQCLEYLALLQGRVQRMEALINGILDYSRAGRVLRKPESIDTALLVKDAIELLAPADSTRINIAPDLPRVIAERVPFQQLFLNLIGNALKYSQAYRPDLVVDIEWKDMEGYYEFSVRDNGPGIASEYHDRIWGVFQTLAARDKVEGTGIGLSVVKKVVETRGGAVAVESSPGCGATFRFTWPKPERGAAAT
jgi:PAS domain S-box-containing protein